LELVNNLCGTSGGDDLLKKVAQMLDGLAKPVSGLVARVGGDEFAVLVPGFNLRQARDFAHSALAAMSGIFQWGGEDISITLSAGVVPLRLSAPSADDVLLTSATALRLAKDGGRSEIRVMRVLKDDGANVSDLQTISMIRRALDQKRLALLSQRIQPLAKAKHQAMHHEILVRIRSETGSLISPDLFIPAAERNHLMPLLDKAILSAALESVKLFPKEDVLSINLSGKTISYPGIYEYIRDKLVSTEVDPQRICFEVTETAAISNEALAIEFIKNIKALGCMISLDDFGTGHHSFRLMKEMSPEFIKIDGAFVRQMFKGDGFDTAAIRSIVDVAEKINAEVIAESVENEETMKALAEMGVSFVQGWHIHRPELIQGF
jgi:diguanylate cyclase (GGDEF)-like protein